MTTGFYWLNEETIVEVIDVFSDYVVVRYIGQYEPEMIWLTLENKFRKVV